MSPKQDLLEVSETLKSKIEYLEQTMKLYKNSNDKVDILNDYKEFLSSVSNSIEYILNDYDEDEDNDEDNDGEGDEDNDCGDDCDNLDINELNEEDIDDNDYY